MKKQIRVLMLVPNLRVSNGVASFAMNYFRSLDHSKIHMDFALYNDISTPYYNEIKDLGSSYYVLPSMKCAFQHFRECRRILEIGKYDILHDNTLLISIPLMLEAKQFGVPVRLLHSHNSKLGETAKKELRNRFFSSLLMKNATDYAACSKLAAKALIGDKEYHFVPNVVSAKRLCYQTAKRNEIRQTMNAKDKIVIGSVGRLAEQKNPHFALEVISALVKMEPSIEYWWIGSGPLDKDFEQAIVERKLQKYVRQLGSREDVPDLYQAMDLFFLPSHFEGLPVTSIEAQAMGLPCIISDSVTDELVYTDLVSFVSLNEPIEVWANVLRNQMNRIACRRSYLKELQTSVFSSESAGEYLISLYNALLYRSDQ